MEELGGKETISLNGFRIYLKNHYGLLELNTEFSRIKKLLAENFAEIKENHMEFEKFIDYVTKYVRHHKNQTEFNDLLEKFTSKKGLTNSEVYKKAYIDRRVYSKLSGDHKYHPGKRTIIALGLAMEVSRYEMEIFLASAGYCLNPCSVFDLVIMYCIENEVYNVNTVNALLVEMGEKILHKE
jgi:hypothetical protein